MAASGQNAQVISQRYFGDGAGLDWSADGQWIIARGGTMLELINVVTGEALPLPYSTTAYQPTFLR